MKNGNNQESGFTIMEILVVFALVLILSTLALQSLSSLRQGTSVEASKAVVDAAIREARSFTISSVEDSQYGVHFEATTVTRFKGDSYNPVSPDNKVYDVPAGSTITDIDLEGGGSDVVFERLTGETDQYGSVTVTSSEDSERQATSTVFQTGLVE